MSRAERRALVERADPVLPVTQQCRLLAVSRASVYRRPAEVSGTDRAIMALIDRQYLARPYYGSRRMAAWLAMQGHIVNRKGVQRLMRLMGLVAIHQRPNTSKNPNAQGFSLPGGDHGLAQPSCAGVAAVKHTRCRVLRRGPVGGPGTVWQARDLQTSAANSPAASSPGCSSEAGSRSAWTAKADAWTTSSSSGCGAA